MPTMLRRSYAAPADDEQQKRPAQTGLKRRPPGMTSTPGSVPSGAQASVDAARAKMAQVGPGYTGSLYGAPGSYTEARPGASGAQVGTARSPAPNPITPVRPAMPGPGTAPGHGGIDVRSYTGSIYGKGAAAAQPIPGYQPQPSAEASADRILKARFGPPPNERGQIDVARGPGPVDSSPIIQTPGFSLKRAPQPNQDFSMPVQAIQPPQQTEAANPLSGTATTQPAETTEAVGASHGSDMGFSSRGKAVPRGTDAQGGTMGGSGIYARSFKSKQSASVYDSYVKKLFGDPQIA